MSAPQVSVVISSYERPESLARLLSALAAQTLARDAFEVIVVDNGSGPHTGRTLARAAVELGLELRTLRHEQTLGPAGGRNSGWHAARAPLVAFTDDDCRPAPDWLARLLDAAAAVPDGQLAVIQGATKPDPEELAALRHTLFARIVAVAAADGRFETCNILYPRALLERLGGFDESFRPRGLRAAPVGEDTDLGWRARALGALSVFVPTAVVYHDVVSHGALGTLAHQTRWAGAAHLFKVHPEARAILFRHVFWNVWHYMLVQALLALALPRWLRRVILGRYLRALRDRAREGGAGTWAVPYLIVHDLTEATVLLGAAVAERTPLI